MPSGHAVYDDGVLRITSMSNPPGLVIAGEIDESTYAGLVGALEHATESLTEIHLSLGGVSYCDLAGLRAIVCVTGASGNLACGNGHYGRHVVLHQVPPQLMTVLHIVGWDSTPGLALDHPGGHHADRRHPDGRHPGDRSSPESAGTSEHDERGSPA